MVVRILVSMSWADIIEKVWQCRMRQRSMFNIMNAKMKIEPDKIWKPSARGIQILSVLQNAWFQNAKTNFHRISSILHFHLHQEWCQQLVRNRIINWKMENRWTKTENWKMGNRRTIHSYFAGLFINIYTQPNTLLLEFWSLRCN